MYIPYNTHTFKFPCLQLMVGGRSGPTMMSAQWRAERLGLKPDTDPAPAPCRLAVEWRVQAITARLCPVTETSSVPVSGCSQCGILGSLDVGYLMMYNMNFHVFTCISFVSIVYKKYKFNRLWCQILVLHCKKIYLAGFITMCEKYYF